MLQQLRLAGPLASAAALLQGAMIEVVLAAFFLHNFFLSQWTLGLELFLV